MKCTIFPLEKAEINGITINLGMNKAEVQKLLGSPEFVDPGDNGGERQYFYDNELGVDFDKDGSVEYIEFLGGIDGNLQPMIYGVPAFQTRADELCEILEENNSGEIEDEENGYSYVYKEIEVRLFRESTPEDAEECIEEMKADGNYTQESAEYERRIANHWASIGISIKGYA